MVDEDRDCSGGAPSSAGFAGTFSRDGRRSEPRRPATPKTKAMRAFAKSMRHTPTDAEAKLWKILRDRRFSGFKFRRQVPIGDYIADFVCFDRRLIVEADGSQHDESPRDVARDRWFALQGFRVRRFWNADILLRPTEVKDTLWADLDGPPSPLAGEGAGEAGG